MNRSLEGLTALDIFFIIRKHIKVIIISSVIFGLISFVFTQFVIHPKYQSKATIIINVKESAGGVITMSDLQLSQNLVDTYSFILKSTPVMESIKDDLNLNISSGALASSITISGVGTTEIIQISVINNDPTLAQKITNDVVRFGPEQISKTMSTGSIVTVESASSSNVPVSPNIQLYVFIAILMGVFGSCAYSVIIELLDNTFKSDEDVTRILGMNLLGIIPLMKNAK